MIGKQWSFLNLVTFAPSNELETYGVPLEKSTLPMSSDYKLSWWYKYLT